MGHFYPAVKTMELFEQCVQRDQGSAFRVWLGKVLPHIEDAYRESDGGFRTHLGISLIGDECAAKIFYGWRWATKSRFSGQTLRLFNRGHLEEGRFVALILTAGMQIDGVQLAAVVGHGVASPRAFQSGVCCFIRWRTKKSNLRRWM